MRVVEPHQFQGVKKPKPNSSKGLIAVAILLLAALVGGGFYYTHRSKGTTVNNDVATPSSDDKAEQTHKTGAFKQFTGEEFRQLYQTIAYPNVQSIGDNLEISGNVVADSRIRKLAEERGYHTTSIPQGAIVKIDEPRLNGDDLLQPLAAEGWKSLKAAATKDGIKLSLISAYRSPEYQRDLFMERLLTNGASPKLIENGAGDAVVRKTLEMTAVPGYSRHHTGYTIDLWCEDGSGTFKVSSCYGWVSANNYLHAKENGWIPSYPEGTDLQGPEPEPWEYVWVGTDMLREAN